MRGLERRDGLGVEDWGILRGTSFVVAVPQHAVCQLLEPNVIHTNS